MATREPLLIILALPISKGIPFSGISTPSPAPLGNLNALGLSSIDLAVATIWTSSASSAAAITTKFGKFAKYAISKLPA